MGHSEQLPTSGLEWPNLHDYTNFVLDEFKFIRIIRSYVGIEVGSYLFFLTYL